MASQITRIRIRKRLFGIFTVRRKWLHKHALFCKFKVSQCWMQRNLLLEPCKRLNIVRKKHSQLFISFMNFRCISSAIWSVKLPSLAVRGGTVGTFCIAATANVSLYRLSMYYMYICAYIPIHAHTYMNMYKYTHTHLHILLWPGKEGSAYHIDHWLQNLLHRLRLKHCTHLSDPEISIKAWRRSHRDHRWQYRASRSMATRHWINISLIVQCLASNALRALAAY